MLLSSNDILQKYDELSAADFIRFVTDCYLDTLGGGLTPDNMGMLTAGYVLMGPFPYILKKEWGMKELSQLIYNVKSEYQRHREQLECAMTDEEFMALYEQLETLNELGDDFLDDHQEEATPRVASYVAEHADTFQITE